MTMIEIKDRRGANVKHYQSQDGRNFAEIYTGTVLTYDAGEGIRENVDFNLQRVNNAQLDGWLINHAAFRYCVGQPAGEVDGWVGFGPRRDSDIWFKYRLAHAAYYHLPSDSFEVLSSASYNRAKLSTKPVKLETGGGENLTVGLTANWADVMPGLDIQWRIDGRGVKEDLVLSRQRFANLPVPSNGSELDNYLVFAFEIDVDGLKIVRAGDEIAPGDDYDAGGDRIEFTDAIDEFLAEIPADYVKTTGGQSTDDGEHAGVALQKRFVRKGGTNYMLVGARLDRLQSLPAGDLIFDPTIEIQPDDTVGKDAYVEGILRANDFLGTSTGMHVHTGYYPTYGKRHAFVQFDLSSIPSGSTCISADLTLTNYNNGAGGATIRAYPMTFNWVEAEINWYQYKTAGTWPGSPGGETGGIDYDDTTLIAEFSGPNKTNTPITASLDTDHFADRFGSSPSITNFGFTLRAITAYNNFWSSGATVAERRPKLVIEYQEAISTAVILTSDTVSPIAAATAGVTFAGATISVIDLPPIPVTAFGNLYLETKNSAVSVLLLMVSGGSDWVAIDGSDNVLTHGLKVERSKGYLLPE